MITDMNRGRPSKAPRSEFGKRLMALRERAGLSQVQLGEQLGLSQRAIAHWERRRCSLYPEQLEALAKALNITLDELVSDKPLKVRQQSGPAGRVRKLFEAVNRLPRRQQDKIADVVEALAAQLKGR
jgi:transcriptional regulator with XRE-family HTH domain